MKNKKLFNTLGILIISICVVIIASLSIITGEIPFFAQTSQEADKPGEGDGSNMGGNFVDIGADGSALEPHQVQYEVTSNFEGLMYFNTYSYGNYNKKDWNNHQEPFYSSYNELNPIYFTSEAIQNSANYDKYKIHIEKYNPQDLNLTPYYLIDGPSNNNDFVLNYQFGKKYDLNFIPFNLVDEKGVKLDSKYKDVYNRYYDYCLLNYLKIPNSTKDVLIPFMDANDITKLDLNQVKTVKDFVINYKADIKSNSIENTDLVIDLIEGNNIPSSLNYASLACMIYRQLGIPSRVAGGYIKDLKKDEKTLIDEKDHICFTEIFVKNRGWVPINVTPDLKKMYKGSNSSKLDNDDHIYPIKPSDIHSPYTGEFVKSDNKIQGLSSFIARGFSYEANVVGERKEYGTSRSYIKSFILYDPSGEDVTQNYHFDFDSGIIQVYFEIINLKTENKDKIYDGKNLSSSIFEIDNKETLDELNHRLVNITYQEPFKNVVRKLNKITFDIYDYDDNNVTDFYYINNNFGYLEIKPKLLKITTNSDKQPFNGHSLTNHGYTQDGLVSGDELIVIINGIQIGKGKSDNTISMVQIRNSEIDTKAIYNYKIIYEYGILELE